jgi:heme-degrading monooxygenase HmoA
MSYVVIDHKVKSFAKWKPLFDAHGKARKRAGCKGGRLYHVKGAPNHVVIVFKWDSTTNARKFIASDDLKTAMTNAGVVGKPKVMFLKEVEAFKR